MDNVMVLSFFNMKKALPHAKVCTPSVHFPYAESVTSEA